MAYELALARATSRLGASLRASGRRVAPERRMSSPVITNTDAGASRSRSACFETEVTWMLPSSSILSSARSRDRGGSAEKAGAAAEARSAPRTSEFCQRTPARIEQVPENSVRTIRPARFVFNESRLSRPHAGVHRANPTHGVGETR